MTGPLPPRCQAYVEEGGALTVRGRRRHRNCRRDATTQRERFGRTYSVCGQHAAQFDKAERGEAFHPNLGGSDW